MTEYVVSGSAGFAGTDFAEKFTASCYDEALNIAQEICLNWCEGYGVEYNPEGESTEGYEEFEDFVTELDFSVEIYSPEKHDMNLN